MRSISSRGQRKGNVQDLETPLIVLSADDEKVPSRTCCQQGSRWLANLLTFEWQAVQWLLVKPHDTASMPAARCSFFTAEFIKGAKFITHTIWPTALAVLMTRDICIFFTHPDDRYGNTLSKIILGLSRNEATWSGNFGSDMPGEKLYWIAPALQLFLPVTAGLAKSITAHFRSRPTDRAQTLVPTAKTPSWSRPLFWLTFPLQLYAAIRRWEFIGQKIVEIATYERDKHACESDAGVYKRAPTGRYECLSCDWPFVPYPQSHSAQGCLDGVLTQSFSPPMQVALVKQLAPQSGFHAVRNVDLSHQAWDAWDETAWDEFLRIFEQAPIERLDSLDLSRPTFNPFVFQDSKVKRVNEFWQKIPIRKVNFKNQGIGPQVVQLLQDPANITTERLILSGNVLHDTDMPAVRDAIAAIPQLRTVELANNKITDDGTGIVKPGLQKSAVTTLDVSDNPLTAHGIDNVMDAARNGTLRHVNLSKISLDPEAVDTVGRGLPALDSVILSDCALDDEELVVLSPHLAKAKTQKYDLSRNNFGDSGLLSFFSGLSPDVARAVDASDTEISAQGFAAVAPFVAEKGIEELAVAGNRLSTESLKAFLLHAQRLKTFNGARNQFGNVGAFHFAQALRNQSYAFQSVNLSGNGITASGGETLFNALPFSAIRHFNMSGNPLTEVAIIRSERFTDRLRVVDLSHTRVNATGFARLLSWLQSTNSTLEHFIFNDNPFDDASAFTYARTVIKPIPPHFERMGDEQPGVDFERAVAEAESATKLKTAAFDESSLTPQGKRAVERASVQSGIQRNNAPLLFAASAATSKVATFFCNAEGACTAASPPESPIAHTPTWLIILLLAASAAIVISLINCMRRRVTPTHHLAGLYSVSEGYDYAGWLRAPRQERAAVEQERVTVVTQAMLLPEARMG